MSGRFPEMDLFPSGTGTQVLHGCRQLVSRDVGVSPATSAPLAFSYLHSVGDSKGTAGDKPEEGGDDVKSSWPLRAWLHTCYNGDYSGQQSREGELISKSRLSSDCSLQLESMKAESLVIADQHAAVNTFPGLVHTARHTMGVGFTRRRCANSQERQATTVGIAPGVKSYLGSRRGSCGWITSFLWIGSKAPDLASGRASRCSTEICRRPHVPSSLETGSSGPGACAGSRRLRPLWVG